MKRILAIAAALLLAMPAAAVVCNHNFDTPVCLNGRVTCSAAAVIDFSACTFVTGGMAVTGGLEFGCVDGFACALHCGCECVHGILNALGNAITRLGKRATQSV